jgi:predicted aspartyl protease
MRQALIVVTVAACLFLRPARLVGCAMPLEPTRTSFTATVVVDGSGPLRFLVDTGSSVTVVDRDVADRLQIRAGGGVAVVSTSGEMQMESAKVSLRAGRLHRTDLDVLLTPLPRFRSHGRVDGILGMNFFEGQSVLLDAKRHCVEVGTRAPAGTTLAAQEVVGRVAARISGLDFVIDSGASFVVLMSDEAKSMARASARADVITVSGHDSSTAGTIDRLAIGDAVLRDVPVVFARSTGDPREDGLLPVTMFRSVYINAERTQVVVR